MNGQLVEFAVGSLCLGASTVFRIRLSEQLAVPTVAAIAPAVALSGIDASRWVGSVASIVIPVGVVLLATTFASRPILERVLHVLAYVLTAGVLSSLVDPTAEVGAVGLALGLLSGSFYLAGDQARQLVGTSAWSRLGEARPMWFLLQLVVLSASGLTVMVLRELGWGAFIAMAGVLAIMRNEFEALGQSRTAVEQTNLALERLTSRAPLEVSNGGCSDQP